MDSFIMECFSAVKLPLLGISLPIPIGYKAHDAWIVAFAGDLSAKVINETPLQYHCRHATNESQFIDNRKIKGSRRYVSLHAFKRLIVEDGKERITSCREKLSFQGMRKAIDIASEKRHGR